MGREVRRVPKDWQHPKKENGNYIPLNDGSRFIKDFEHWNKEQSMWLNGFRTEWGGGVVPLTEDEKRMSYATWAGERPDPQKYMPQWSAEERTHLMMYEDTSEGTPISPAFADKEQLATWLVENKASVFANDSTDYNTWMSIIEDSCASIMVAVKQIDGENKMQLDNFPPSSITPNKNRKEVFEFVEFMEWTFAEKVKEGKYSLVYDFTIDRFNNDTTNDLFGTYLMGKRAERKADQ